MSFLAATEPQAIAMQKLVRLVASSSAFQRRAGVTSTTAAEARIHWPWLDKEPQEGERPFAVVEEVSYEWDMKAASDYLNEGALVLTLVDNANHLTNHRSSWTDFRNFCGGVISDVLLQAGSDDRLAITGITQTQMPLQSDPTKEPSETRYWSARYQVDWNPIG